jgi:hypothetical protein
VLDAISDRISADPKSLLIRWSRAARRDVPYRPGTWMRRRRVFSLVYPERNPVRGVALDDVRDAKSDSQWQDALFTDADDVPYIVG